MHFAALFMIPPPPRSRLLSILGCSINFRIDGAPTPRRRSPMSCAAMKFIAPRISRTSPRAMVDGHRDRGKSDIYPGTRVVLDAGYLKVSSSRAICTRPYVHEWPERGAIHILRGITVIKLYGPRTEGLSSLADWRRQKPRLIAKCGICME